MKKCFLVFSLLFFSLVHTFAQYNIGEKEFTFVDQSRSRQIPCQIFYPALTAGTDAPIINDKFPLLIFAHGYLMGYASYKNFVDNLVPHGFVIVFPKTEGGVFPNHQEFANDLVFLNTEIQTISQSQNTFLLYNKLNGRTCLMGHSMGGGASMLASKNNSNISLTVNFAAAETSVSAIEAAADISVPCFMYTGTNDGVTPPNEHQIPMYQNLNTSCSGLIQIKGGGHCYFANYNLACATGELATSPQPAITRELQHTYVFQSLLPLLEWFLKWNISQESVFKNIINQSSIYDVLLQCAISNIAIHEDFNLHISPNPFFDSISISCNGFCDDIQTIRLLDIQGKTINVHFFQNNDSIEVNTSQIAKGIYILEIQTNQRIYQSKIIKE